MSEKLFTMRQLLEAGVHYGHMVRRWNPKMKKYIFGERNGIHIINLEVTVPMLERALDAIESTTKNGGKILFVGTKRQAQHVVKECAENSKQYYVNHRWLGGMMTNWKTVTQSIKRLVVLEKEFEEGVDGYTKRELISKQRTLGKLQSTLGGIKDLKKSPDLFVVFDINKDKIAIQEARSLGIPIVAIVDTNTDPDLIDYPIPGNDDAVRSLELYGNLFVSAALKGMKANASSNKDAGADVNPIAENLGK